MPTTKETLFICSPSETAKGYILKNKFPSSFYNFTLLIQSLKPVIFIFSWLMLYVLIEVPVVSKKLSALVWKYKVIYMSRLTQGRPIDKSYNMASPLTRLIITWLCLTRTGNYHIQEFDWLKWILTEV